MAVTQAERKAIQAVCASVRNEVRYHVEKYTGVKVSEVRISVETVSAE